MGLEIRPLKINVTIESTPPKSIMLVRKLAVTQTGLPALRRERPRLLRGVGGGHALRVVEPQHSLWLKPIIDVYNCYNVILYYSIVDHIIS